MPPHDSAWRILSDINEWLRFADAKAAATLAAAGLLGAGLVDRATTAGTSNGCAWAVAAMVFSAAATAAAAAAAVAALIPRLRVGEPTSLLYFEHIGRRFAQDPAGYQSALKNLVSDEDRLLAEISAQVWANSVIARRKHLWAAVSFRALALALGAAGLAAVFAAAG